MINSLSNWGSKRFEFASSGTDAGRMYWNTWEYLDVYSARGQMIGLEFLKQQALSTVGAM